MKPDGGVDVDRVNRVYARRELKALGCGHKSVHEDKYCRLCGTLNPAFDTQEYAKYTAIPLDRCTLAEHAAELAEDPEFFETRPYCPYCGRRMKR